MYPDFFTYNILISGAVLFSNVYTVHMDQEYWKDPEKFRPERFLTNNGQYEADERNKRYHNYYLTIFEVGGVQPPPPTTENQL